MSDRGEPSEEGLERVEVHDFPDSEVVFDVGANEGWMSVGDDHDTAAFAVNAIRRWWRTTGAERDPNARRSSWATWPPRPAGGPHTNFG